MFAYRDFFRAGFILFRSVRSMRSEKQASPRIDRALQADTELSTRIQGKTGCRGAIHDVPSDDKLEQADTEPSTEHAER